MGKNKSSASLFAIMDGRESLQHVGELFMWQTVESKAERGRCWRDMTAREALKELS